MNFSLIWVWTRAFSSSMLRLDGHREERQHLVELRQMVGIQVSGLGEPSDSVPMTVS